MNKEELIKEFDERQKLLRDEFISKLEDEKKEFELTYPKDKERVYFINKDTVGISETYFWSGASSDRLMFEMGGYFKTKEEAEHYDRERQLIQRMKDWAIEHREGFKGRLLPRWNIKYNYRIECFEYIFSPLNQFSKIPCFISRDIAEQFIDEFGDEIKEVLC